MNNIETMTIEDIEARAAEIAGLMAAEDADLDALTEEVRALQDRKTQILEERKAAAEAVAAGAGEEIKKPEKENRTMTLKELRSSSEYENAYAEYIKSSDDREVRRLLTELGTEQAGEGDSASVPVPWYVEDRIRTAWEKNEFTQHIRKTYVPGILRVGFELSATGAAVHNEGAAAVPEEQLKLGAVSLMPTTIKKWIRISTEVAELKGRAFLDYIYDEISYRIVKKIANNAINAAVVLGEQGSDSQVGLPLISAAPSASTVAQAEGYLSDDAQNIFAVMNRRTWAAFKAITTGDGYPLSDPFDGATVIFNDSLPAYDAAKANDIYMLVGDLDGIQANFPNGEDVKFVYDELSLAEQDLVKIVGRLVVGIGVTTPNCITRVAKPTA